MDHSRTSWGGGDRRGRNPRSQAPGARSWDRDSPERMELGAYTEEALRYDELDQAELLGMFARYMSPGKVAAIREMHYDFIPGRREGIRLWDLDGRCFINCRTSGGVFNLGHRPPRIRAALHEALERFDIGDHILLSGPRALLARRLAGLMPADLQYSFFGTSGAEVNEHALKLARGITGRRRVVSIEGGYYGASGMAMQAGGDQWLVGERDPSFVRVPEHDLEAIGEAIDDRTAAVIIETIPATSGFAIPAADYLREVRKLCDASGTLLVVDETQTGLGRTGRLWAFEGWDVVPDVVTVGKGPAGAHYPIAFCTWRREHDRFFRERPLVHTSSFAGSDLGCIVALAVLDQVTEPGFFEHVREMGQRLVDGLQRISERTPGWIREVRGRGLMLGIEGPHPTAGFDLSRACLARGVLTIAALNRPSTMQLMPPLIIVEEEVDEVLDVIGDAVAELVRRTPAGTVE